MDGRVLARCAEKAHSLGRWKWGIAHASLLAFLLGAGGCYVYPPVVTAPAPGTELLLDLDDQGRAGLGNLIGPAAASVQGVLQNSPDTAYALKVTSVMYLNGQSSPWTGEQLTVPKAFVVNTRERKFSKSRTWLTSGGIVAVVGGFIVSRALLGSGTSDSDKGSGSGNENR